ncbi:MAG: SBBP repeat-containing protein [Terracidiphilus sp.]
MKSLVGALLFSVSAVFVAGCNGSSHHTTPTPPSLTFSAGSSFYFVNQFGTGTFDATTQQGDTIAGIAQDSLNNIYVAGSTVGNLPGYSVPVGVSKGVVFGRDPDGNAVWARELTTGAGDTINGMVLAGDYVIVAGTTKGAYPGASNPNGISQVFLAELDAVGAVVWLYQYPSAGGITVEALTQDANGNLIVAGEIAGGTTARNLIVEKFDPKANLLWAMTYGTGAQDSMYGVTADSNGDIYVIGSASGAFPGSASGSPTTQFVAKVTGANGSVVWVQQQGSVPALAGFTPSAILATANGQLYLEGQTGTYGTDAQIEVMQMSASAGAIAWHYLFGAGSSNIPGKSIVVDSNGNFYVAGMTGGALVSGATAGVDDVFLAKLSASGNAIWAQQLGTGKEGPRVSSTVATPIYLNSGSMGVAVGGMTSGAFSGFSNPNQNADLFAARYGP